MCTPVRSSASTAAESASTIIESLRAADAAGVRLERFTTNTLELPCHQRPEETVSSRLDALEAAPCARCTTSSALRASLTLDSETPTSHRNLGEHLYLFEAVVAFETAEAAHDLPGLARARDWFRDALFVLVGEGSEPLDEVFDAKLQVRIDRTREAPSFLTCGSGLDTAMEWCALHVIPTPELPVLVPASLTDEIEAATMRARRALTSSSTWVLAHWNRQHHGTDKHDGVVMVLVDAFTVAPGTTYAPLAVHARMAQYLDYSDSLTLAEQLPADVLENFCALHAPDGDGPYNRITAALAAAEAL